MATQYCSAVERLHHLKAIQALSQELHISVDTVRDQYEYEFDRLQVGAKVRDYLLLLTARRVRESLHHNR